MTTRDSRARRRFIALARRVALFSCAVTLLLTPTLEGWADEILTEFPGRFLRGIAYENGELFALHSEVGGDGDVVKVARLDA
ncbi:MAG: hypothetical protein ACREA0_28315, partial [bacterium]